MFDSSTACLAGTSIAISTLIRRDTGTIGIKGVKHMAKFYLDTQSQPEVGNQIHDSECSQLPAREQLQYIGSYSNPQAARTDVKMFHEKVSYCPHCLGQ